MSTPSDARTVLVTGAAGFIGSHTAVELVTAGYDVVGVDNFANSSPGAVERIRRLADGPGSFEFVELDLRDRAALTGLLRRRPVDAAIHFAARKAVGESVDAPLEYYDTNVNATLGLVATMLDRGVSRLVFSSSCSIYGDARTVPLREDAPAGPTNPYARTKWMCEQILADICHRHPSWHVTSLRYFNPAGAHPSGLLGEDPRGIPNNVLPYIAQVAVGRRAELSIFGDDYPTPDGTGIRDYIHVVDIAEGHRLALERLDEAPGHRVINLGTGRGTSVRELLTAFSAACGRRLPSQVVARRPGDVAELVADPSLAAALLGWKSTRDVADMCRDAWNFQRLNPDGYDDTDSGGTGK
ncbi:UDP-glucose 4-epimerase GalE [Pseudofrankia asymbiotica]|uniref:UDP-glucose 4-epimerase n=1 Tax=Pseudofrankia asymbiotica TaxID=1834516 RepID=A0A1V2I9Y6_9ACTN|nr:UDP-glucose 4-epimerase GalE [Pseudofrankia asymbiotica]ONH28968.1 UDP-glucose 4-epimerase GalE [Pseudofrankia asymbiotica]